MTNPLAGKSAATHSIAGAVAFLVGIAQLPQAQAAIAGFLGAHPQISTAVAGLAAILALYRSPSTPAGS